MTTQGFGCSHVGRRENNEDAFVCNNVAGLYAVADGMGGYEGGEVASQCAIQSLEGFFARAMPPRGQDFRPLRHRAQSVAEARMAMAVRQASKAIEKRRVGELSGMGTTMAAVLVGDGQALVAHVGDSRVYRLRGRKLSALTKDHTLYAELVEAGVGVTAASVHRSTVTRALGVPGCARPDLSLVDLEPGDRLLVCSDGLHEVLTHFELTLAMLDPEVNQIADRVVQRAYDVGGDDNITAIVVAV